MDTVMNFLETLSNSPHYSYGWIILAVLAILPAIVSVNLLQHDLSKYLSGKTSLKQIAKPMLYNVVIFIVCICIMAYAFYIYVWI
jgi:hypothetical protein